MAISDAIPAGRIDVDVLFENSDKGEFVIFKAKVPFEYFKKAKAEYCFGRNIAMDLITNEFEALREIHEPLVTARDKGETLKARRNKEKKKGL